MKKWLKISKKILRTYLEGTGEEAGPEWLDIDGGGLEDGGDLVASDLAVVIVQDESGICAGELRGHIRNLFYN